MSIITILAPAKCVNEIEYTIDTVFSDFLGLNYSLLFDDRDDFEIVCGSGCLILDATFFNNAHEKWLLKSTLPSLPVKTLTLENELCNVVMESELPILFGENTLEITDKNAYFGFDLFGTIFFMLSRYEEYFEYEGDEYNRFTSKDSFAKRMGVLSRPLVNELIEILWFSLSKIDNTLNRKKREFIKTISADIDNPYLPSNVSIKRLIRRLVGDLIVRKQPLDVFNTLISYIFFKLGFIFPDRYMRCLKWMMSENEKVGNIMSFFIIPDNSGSEKNGVYMLDDKHIINLLKEISNRGHKIGVHPSFHTYDDKDRITSEINKLRSFLKSNDIVCNYPLESRQHYLRWNVHTTNKYLFDAGVKIDNSLGFNDHVGFRSGCCTSHNWYDSKERKQSSLIVKPLIVMDCSAVTSMGLGSTQLCLEEIIQIRDVCQYYKGEFSMLWHNSFFDEKFNKIIYREIIR